MRSRLPLIMNPTRDDYWDGYYTIAWAIFGPIVLLILIILGIATYNTFFR